MLNIDIELSRVCVNLTYALFNIQTLFSEIYTVKVRPQTIWNHSSYPLVFSEHFYDFSEMLFEIWNVGHSVRRSVQLMNVCVCVLQNYFEDNFNLILPGNLNPCWRGFF